MRSISEIQADIASTRAAIEAVKVLGASYTLNNQTVTHADLDKLKKDLADLLAELKQARSCAEGDDAGASGWGVTRLLRGP